LIADTHGLLRPAARDFLNAADYIVHAGDIGDRRILDELLRVAPVSAVRGNNDRDPWAAAPARHRGQRRSATIQAADRGRGALDRRRIADRAHPRSFERTRLGVVTHQLVALTL